MVQINSKIKFLFFLFILSCNNTFSQINRNNCFSINPFIDSFIENLIDKETSLSKNYLTLKSLKDKDGSYNIDFALTVGNLDNFKINSDNEMKLKYGNINLLLYGETEDDFKFLKKSIKKTNKIFHNKDSLKNNAAFYDEDYVWSTFFNNKKELTNFYIPEEKDSAYKIFENLKNEIKISPNFKNLDCNCF